MTGNKSVKIADDNFKELEGYEFEEHEKDLFHVAWELPQYTEGGKRISKPRIWKGTKMQYEFMKKHKGFANKKTYVLHSSGEQTKQQNTNTTGSQQHNVPATGNNK